jgi:hypothetical protein
VFLTLTGGNQLVVTSRIVGYHSRPLLKGYLTHVTVEPMDDTAISHFCDSWMSALAKRNKPKIVSADINNFPQVELKSHSPNLIQIPVECWLMVFSYLTSAKDLAKARCVCKKWRKLLYNSSVLPGSLLRQPLTTGRPSIFLE